MRPVFIRPYEIEDAENIYAVAREALDHPSGYWMPWCHSGFDLEEARTWIAKQMASRNEGTAFPFAIIDASGAFLGEVTINQIHPVHRFGNVGYWVRPSASGRGVASEATSQLIRFAEEKTQLVRLELVVPAENRASLRVANKLGARREGIQAKRLIHKGKAVDAVMFSVVFDRDCDSGRN